MAKGQQRKNKEAKKPKMETPPTKLTSTLYSSNDDIQDGSVAKK